MWSLLGYNGKLGSLVPPLANADSRIMAVVPRLLIANAADNIGVSDCLAIVAKLGLPNTLFFRPVEFSDAYFMG